MGLFLLGVLVGAAAMAGVVAWHALREADW